MGTGKVRSARASNRIRGLRFSRRERKSLRNKLTEHALSKGTVEDRRRIAGAIFELEQGLAIEWTKEPKSPIAVQTPTQVKNELKKFKGALMKHKRMLDSVKKSLRYGLATLGKIGELRTDGIQRVHYKDPLGPAKKETYRLLFLADLFVKKLDNSKFEAVKKIMRPGGAGRSKDTVVDRVALLCGLAYKKATGREPRRNVGSDTNPKADAGEEYGSFNEFVDLCVAFLKRSFPKLTTRGVAEKAAKKFRGFGEAKVRE